MRMKVGLVALSLVAGSLGAPDISTAAGYEPQVVLTPAKNRSSVTALGKVYGARAKERLRIKLFKYFPSSDTHKLKAKTVARTRWTSLGYRTYRVSFQRPKKGTCELRVKVVGMPSTEQKHRLPCRPQRFGEGTATLSNGATAKTIEVLIADDERERQHGLMYRERLPADKGMVFVFPGDASGGFWMKNTLIPLSIAFFSADGEILRILDMEPCEVDPCPTYNPGVTYSGALEVNMGRFEEWGIGEGDRIEVHPNDG
ncbi:MAG: DUF192 domain-containing protein [Actinomycetota bacterium]